MAVWATTLRIDHKLPGFVRNTQQFDRQADRESILYGIREHDVASARLHQEDPENTT
jgi:hypothetical protein